MASVIEVPSVPALLDLVQDFFLRWEDVQLRPADGEVEGRCVMFVHARNPEVGITVVAYLVALDDRDSRIPKPLSAAQKTY